VEVGRRKIAAVNRICQAAHIEFSRTVFKSPELRRNQFACEDDRDREKKCAP
jgi:hypothetical protein